MNPEDENFDPEELRQLFTGEIQYPSKISFYLDESADQHLRSLWREGIEVTTVEAQDQKGVKSDIRILAHARQLGYVLIAKDVHFEEIHKLIQSTEGASHAGIVLMESDEAKLRPSFVIEFIIGFTSQTEYAPNVAENALISI